MNTQAEELSRLYRANVTTVATGCQLARESAKAKRA